jgi:hypothetical protein
MFAHASGMLCLLHRAAGCAELRWRDAETTDGRNSIRCLLSNGGCLGCCIPNRSWMLGVLVYVGTELMAVGCAMRVWLHVEGRSAQGI